MISKELLVQNLPATKRSMVSDELVERLNASITGSEEERELLRENFLGYLDVLKDGKYKMDDYLAAVKYVSYKLMGNSNIQAWSKTFPDRYMRLMADSYLETQIHSYVTAYNKNKLVNLIMAQTMVPTYVLNQDIHQKAINQLAYLMVNAKSEKVQADAASALLTQLKAPEAQKIDLSVKVEQQDGLDTLNATLVKLAEQQKELIARGAGTKAIAHQKLELDILDAEYQEVTHE